MRFVKGVLFLILGAFVFVFLALGYYIQEAPGILGWFKRAYKYICECGDQW